ncbi:hypothetical protein K227x_53250 [Rubripirellula lacrimiformis]|uniref:Uncharacterized protein n=1 Tax=Rubripirellula lacrimiformis TaxID=1930273 RepID=A0A517NIE7_9BACT|nr:hypothetical protein K227x_53250 [Rubripirellula lacrimiformis]
MTTRNLMTFRSLPIGKSFHFGNCTFEKVDDSAGLVVRDKLGDVPKSRTKIPFDDETKVVVLDRRSLDHD